MFIFYTKPIKTTFTMREVVASCINIANCTPCRRFVDTNTKRVTKREFGPISNIISRTILHSNANFGLSRRSGSNCPRGLFTLCQVIVSRYSYATKYFFYILLVTRAQCWASLATPYHANSPIYKSTSSIVH